MEQKNSAPFSILAIDEKPPLPYNIVLLAQCASKFIAGWSSR
ncbi:hypothetical protein HMPREF9163_01576 [Selenomonas sp. oral taxon 138 str. F0429]|nr:hypothetical protein HMPREF9163_01576 [Selenomonas sp. oral taxon 138 str. F0429]